MKFIITLLGASGLEFENPTGIYEASCSVSIELSSLTIALPKTSSKLKNTAPRWNKQAEFAVDGFGGTYLNITLIETSDACVQRTMGTASIPLTYFESLEENEVRILLDCYCFFCLFFFILFYIYLFYFLFF
jgi:hypothetical protein